jgi:hypothetical protein
MRAMLGLTDHQLNTVMDAARAVPVERRSVFLERTAAMLRLRRPFTYDVQEVTALALCGLVQAPTAV